jgi:hypothetical protein
MLSKVVAITSGQTTFVNIFLTNSQSVKIPATAHAYYCILNYPLFVKDILSKVVALLKTNNFRIYLLNKLSKRKDTT